MTDDALQTSTIDDINYACEEEEELFDYTKSLLEKTKIEKVAAAMKSNNLTSKIIQNHGNLNYNLSLNDEDVKKICINMGRDDISFVRIVIANDKAILYKQELTGLQHLVRFFEYFLETGILKRPDCHVLNLIK